MRERDVRAEVAVVVPEWRSFASSNAFRATDGRAVGRATDLRDRLS